MRLSSVLLAGGLAAAALLPLSAAQAAPVGAVAMGPGAARVLADRTALFSVTAVAEGDLADHEGNWHTVVVTANGADGVSGVVADWTCPEGVAPNFQDDEAAWLCAPESVLRLDDTFDENGISLLTLRVSRGAAKVVIEGEVEVTDPEGTEATGELRLVGRAYGARTRTVTDDGVTRLVVDERGDTQARGDVLGVAVDQPGFEVDTSHLVALATYLPRPVYQPLPYLM
jgi:hypothetical protein